MGRKLTRLVLWLGMLLSAILVGSCTVRVDFSQPKTQPPPTTIYLFDLDPPEREAIVYEELLKSPSENISSSLTGGSGYELKQVATISGQRYIRIFPTQQAIALRLSPQPVSLEDQKNYFSGRSWRGYLEYLGIMHQPGKTYYATVRARKSCEFGPNSCDSVVRFAAEFLLWNFELWPFGEHEERTLTDLRAEYISADEAQKLFAQLKPQPEMAAAPTS